MEIYDVLMGLDCKVICPFAFANKREDYLVSTTDIDTYTFAHDRQKMEAFEYLVNKMSGTVFLPFTQKPGLKFNSVGNDRVEVVTTNQVT